ncbi:nucleoside triphosphate pyrophosphohydrolase family protein [Desulfosporosinus shakirovi]|uniref:hypothetical protein n=1 Tax=Desulfosporosinus shakirovi TaxID=2885154 RepID=UPI001E4D49DE|nr:hypothetical protein [Desulfosporosinus sp. SRJS8]MCB8814652.1 hypothetical protein [Desulfosporosinus sp. SRJS8]
MFPKCLVLSLGGAVLAVQGIVLRPVRIPQIIEDSGKKAIIEKVSGPEYLDLLNAKLGEELQEFWTAKG